MIVQTPERIAFSYEVAGIGSRFLAQALDAVMIAVLIAGSVGLAWEVGAIAGGPAGSLTFVLLLFLISAGYFWISESVSGGRTFGKALVRVRVVGMRGEPVTFSQVAIRNLVRWVDFLPFLYGVGIVSAFVSEKSQRLGDFAAGTVVVRERGKVTLSDLGPGHTSGARPPGSPERGPVLQVPPEMRRFVAAYARRSGSLSEEERRELAEEARPALERLMPDLTRDGGPLAALDRLADTLR